MYATRHRRTTASRPGTAIILPCGRRICVATTVFFRVPPPCSRVVVTRAVGAAYVSELTHPSPSRLIFASKQGRDGPSCRGSSAGDARNSRGGEAGYFDIGFLAQWGHRECSRKSRRQNDIVRSAGRRCQCNWQRHDHASGTDCGTPREHVKSRGDDETCNFCQCSGWTTNSNSSSSWTFHVRVPQLKLRVRRSPRLRVAAVTMTPTATSTETLTRSRTVHRSLRVVVQSCSAESNLKSCQHEPLALAL